MHPRRHFRPKGESPKWDTAYVPPSLINSLPNIAVSEASPPPIDMARRGIAGRGVLLDWRRYALINKIPYSPFSFHAIPLADLKAVAAEQNVTFRPGDILIVRSGFAEEYNRFSAEERNALWKRSERNFVGVDSSEECIRWHWDMGFAAVAGDTVAYEAWPSPREWGVSLHEVGWVFYGSFLGLGLLMALFV
jgi:hypothetical protein